MSEEGATMDDGGVAEAQLGRIKALLREREELTNTCADMGQACADATLRAERAEQEARQHLLLRDDTVRRNREIADERDALQAALDDARAAVDVLVKERDALRDDLAFLGAARTPEGGLSLDMRKYHAAHRCEAHHAIPYREQADLDGCVACLAETARKYALLKTAVNESVCSPECNSYGHAEKCPSVNAAQWMEDMQARLTATLPCGHLAYANDDSYGGCSVCKLHETLKSQEEEIEELRGRLANVDGCPRKDVEAMTDPHARAWVERVMDGPCHCRTTQPHLCVENAALALAQAVRATREEDADILEAHYDGKGYILRSRLADIPPPPEE